MGELDRVRWQCRRGMLELDLILAKFNEMHLAGLSPEQLARFTELLALADNDLFDLVMGRCETAGGPYDELLGMLRSA